MPRKKLPPTQRKTKILGHQSLLHRDTGEIIDVHVISIEERDANFHKLWLGHVLNAIGELGSEKITVLFWLISNADRYNQVIATTRKIAENCNVSVDTVTRTLRVLRKHNIVRMRQRGVWVLNPDVVFNGPRHGRLNVLLQYQQMAGDSYGETHATHEAVKAAISPSEAGGHTKPRNQVAQAANGAYNAP